MTRRWIKERKKDYFYRKAKAENYRSRASFKLKQLDRKFRIIKKGDRVLDLGAAPGGWMQVARERVGDEGSVLGVDIVKIQEFEYDNMEWIQGDLTKEETIDEIKRRMPSADVVISDASPDISGVWDIDHFRSVDLCKNVFKIAKDILTPGGNILIKIFQGEHTKEFYDEIRSSFSYSKITKPKASRGQSAEVYIVGKGFNVLA